MQPSPPKLVLYASDIGGIKEAVVVGDGVKVLWETWNVYLTFLILIAVYHATDL
jgi:hypothetical protein